MFVAAPFLSDGVSPFVLQESLSPFEIDQGLWDWIDFELENLLLSGGR